MATSLSCLAGVSFLMELELGVQMGPGAAVSPTGLSGKGGVSCGGAWPGLPS